jgi:hypothetical protein
MYQIKRYAKTRLLLKKQGRANNSNDTGAFECHNPIMANFKPFEKQKQNKTISPRGNRHTPRMRGIHLLITEATENKKFVTFVVKNLTANSLRHCLNA